MDPEETIKFVLPNSIAEDATNLEMVKVEQNVIMNSSNGLTQLIPLAHSGDKAGLAKYLNSFEEDESLIRELFERDKLGRTCLHWAADNNDLSLAIECCKLLVESIQDNVKRRDFINTKDNQDRSALIWSAAKGNAPLMQYFIQNGCDLTIKDKLNKTPLHFSAEFGDHEKGLQCSTAFLEATDLLVDDKLRLEVINRKESYSERSALHLATIAGNELLMEFLVRSGANVLEFDSNKYTVLHHSVINAYPEKALLCTRTLLSESLIEESTKAALLDMKETYGRGAIHIASRRGNAEVLKCLRDNSVNYLIQEDASGNTALHLAASLGNETKAAACVSELLESLSDAEKGFLVNIQNNDKFTAMYLAAKHRNVEACKHLLKAGSAFDKKTSHGKTPLEKVYKKIPEAVTVLLDKAVESSGYANRFGSIDSYVDMNFAPILGINTNNQNLYKEIEELAKIQYAKWDQRIAILKHPFIQIFIWKKWEKISWIFSLARFFHMLWFVSIFAFLVMVYRVHCPFKSSKSVKFSWTGLRPSEEADNDTLKTLNECNFNGFPIVWGTFNILGLILFVFGLFHQTKDYYHWFYKPLRTKPQIEKTTMDKLGIVFILHYLKAFFQIVPIVSIILVILVLIITAPVFGIFPLKDDAQYSIVGLMGFIVWFGFYLEVGKIPFCRVYINLLWKASSTLGVAILIHLPILFGFAAVFVLLMQRMPSFSSASQAVVKVLTLMIGELDYEELFYGEEDNTGNILFAGIEMLALAIFVIFVTVLLLNFLIGLAADEIKDFRERAEVWHLCTQIEQISLLESFLDQKCCKNFLRKKLMLMPPKKNQEQRRRLEVYIPTLPKQMQRSIHNLNLKTLPEEK